MNTVKYNGGSSVFIIGKVGRGGAFAYERDGENFYEVLIKVADFETEFMGNNTLIPVIMSEYLLEKMQTYEGEQISVNCCLHSYAKKTEDGHSRLNVEIRARYLDPGGNQKDSIIVSLVGYLCKPPIVKKKADGEMLVSALLSVERDGRSDISDYIPFIVKDAFAEKLCELPVGEKICGIGVMKGCASEENLANKEELTIFITNFIKYPTKPQG